MFDVHYLRWYLRKQVARFGFFGVGGLGLLAFCAMFYFSAVLPLQAETSRLRSETVSMQTGPDHQGKFSDPPTTQLDAFYQNFPNQTRLPDVLEALNRVAQEHGVILEHGEYRLLPAGADKLVHYEMTLPIKSDYLHLRAFLSNLLVEWPNLSVDSLAFQRQKISDPTLEAQVKLTAFFVERTP